MAINCNAAGKDTWQKLAVSIAAVQLMTSEII